MAAAAAGDAGETRDALAARASCDRVNGQLEALDFRGAAEAILQLAGVANGFLNERAPWKAMKQDGQEQAVAADLYAVLEASRLVAVLLAPLLPDLSARMLQQLGEVPFESGSGSAPDQRWPDAQRWGLLPPGQPLPQPEPVLQRLELDSPL
jgi:methionyl-tRNA synthetase